MSEVVECGEVVHFLEGLARGTEGDHLELLLANGEVATEAFVEFVEKSDDQFCWTFRTQPITQIAPLELPRGKYLIVIDSTRHEIKHTLLESGKQILHIINRPDDFVKPSVCHHFALKFDLCGALLALLGLNLKPDERTANKDKDIWASSGTEANHVIVPIFLVEHHSRIVAPVKDPLPRKVLQDRLLNFTLKHTLN